jgi:DNA transformation protein and related proteins
MLCAIYPRRLPSLAPRITHRSVVPGAITWTTLRLQTFLHALVVHARVVTVAISQEYLRYVLEQLGGLGRISSRRMFGGAGIYCGELFFALVFEDQLYFKVGDANRAEYEERDMRRFKPYANRPELSMTYYTVPVDVLEDSEQLREWGRRSVAAALISAKANKAKRSRKGR